MGQEAAGYDQWTPIGQVQYVVFVAKEWTVEVMDRVGDWAN